MAGEKEVKAQVRLRFWNVKRERMVVNRNLQVTVKKTGGMTMKTLEGMLSKVDGAEQNQRNSISTKCAEMDAEVPRLLGVSKAILDNVIFCHQEESNWPLSEPSALKKKFDDIFEASKFTKALDHIKSIRKEKNAGLKVDEERLKYLKSDKTKAERLRNKITEERSSLTSKESQVETLQEEVTQKKKTNAEFYDKARTFTDTYDKAEMIQKEVALLERNKVDMKKQMSEVLKANDDELQRLVTDFEKDMKQVDGDLRSKQRNKAIQSTALQNARARSRSEVATLGQRQAARKNYDSAAKDRQDAIHKQAKDLGIEGFERKTLNREDVKAYVEILTDKMKSAQAEVETIKREGENHTSTLTESLNDLRSQKSTNQQIAKDRNRQYAAVQQQIRSLSEDMESSSTADVEVKNIERDIAQLTALVETVTRELKEATYDDKIRQIGQHLRYLESERETLNQEYTVLMRQGESRVKLGLAREKVEDLDRQIGDQVSANASRFQHIIEDELIPGQMKERIDAARRTNENNILNNEQTRQKQRSEQVRWEAELQASTSKVSTMETEFKALEQEITQALEADQFSVGPDLLQTLINAIREAEDELKVRDNDLQFMTNAQSFWRTMLDHQKAKGCCKGCNREFDAGDLDAFLKYIERQEKKAASTKKKEELATATSEVELWRGVLKKHEVYKQQYQDRQTKQNEVLVDTKAQIKKLQSKIDTAKTEIDELDNKRSKLKQRSKDLDVLDKAAIDVLRCLDEKEKAENEVENLERSLSTTGSTKTPDDVQVEVQEKDAAIKAKREEETKLKTDRDQNTARLRQREHELSQKRVDLSNAQVRLNRRQESERKVKDLQVTSEQHSADIKASEKAAKDLDGPIRDKEDELRRYNQKHKDSLTDASQKHDKFKINRVEIDGYTRQIKQYDSENGDKLLAEAEETCRELEHQILDADTQIEELQEEITKLERQLAQGEARKSNIQVNIRYRSDGKRISDLKEELEGLDVEGAARAKKSFEARWSQVVHEAEEKQEALSSLKGQIVTIRENIRSLQKELAADYKNIQDDYTECLVKFKTGQMACADLDKYSKALDNAIMQYHGLKMAEVNDTLQELWHDVYTGTDIDYIAIRAEAGTETATRRTYNYRVAMVKNQTELDMRGRCSAGQKVLASILIRIALAESLSLNCGVLALDEPTTNLDVDHIESLARSLAHLIRLRKDNASSQLIIITHDENFLRLLAAEDACDFYWRVSRDINMNSIVERQRISLA